MKKKLSEIDTPPSEENYNYDVIVVHKILYVQSAARGWSMDRPDTAGQLKVNKIKVCMEVSKRYGHKSFERSKIRYFRSTFIASRYKYILNNECIKGEEVEKVFSGLRIS